MSKPYIELPLTSDLLSYSNSQNENENSLNEIEIPTPNYLEGYTAITYDAASGGYSAATFANEVGQGGSTDIIPVKNIHMGDNSYRVLTEDAIQWDCAAVLAGNALDIFSNYDRDPAWTEIVWVLYINDSMVDTWDVVLDGSGAIDYEKTILGRNATSEVKLSSYTEVNEIDIVNCRLTVQLYEGQDKSAEQTIEFEGVPDVEGGSAPRRAIREPFVATITNVSDDTIEIDASFNEIESNIAPLDTDINPDTTLMREWSIKVKSAERKLLNTYLHFGDY